MQQKMEKEKISKNKMWFVENNEIANLGRWIMTKRKKMKATIIKNEGGDTTIRVYKY